MKEILHLGLVQADLLWEDPQGNRAALAELVLVGAEERAAAQRALQHPPTPNPPKQPDSLGDPPKANQLAPVRGGVFLSSLS